MNEYLKQANKQPALGYFQGPVVYLRPAITDRSFGVKRLSR